MKDVVVVLGGQEQKEKLVKNGFAEKSSNKMKGIFGLGTKKKVKASNKKNAKGKEWTEENSHGFIVNSSSLLHTTLKVKSQDTGKSVDVVNVTTPRPIFSDIDIAKNIPDIKTQEINHSSAKENNVNFKEVTDMSRDKGTGDLVTNKTASNCDKELPPIHLRRKEVTDSLGNKKTIEVIKDESFGVECPDWSFLDLHGKPTQVKPADKTSSSGTDKGVVNTPAPHVEAEPIVNVVPPVTSESKPYTMRDALTYKPYDEPYSTWLLKVYKYMSFAKLGEQIPPDINPGCSMNVIEKMPLMQLHSCAQGSENTTGPVLFYFISTLGEMVHEGMGVICVS